MADTLAIEITVAGAQNAVQQLSRVAQAAGQLSVVGSGGAGGGGAGTGIIDAEFTVLSNVAKTTAAGLSAFQVALTALVLAVGTATTNLIEFGRLRGGLAGTTGETGTLLLLGKALGFDPQGAAAGIRSQMFGNPLGMAAAGRLGLDIQPFDINQRLDLGKLLIDALKGARSEFERDPGQAMADLQNLGLGQLTFLIQGHKDLIGTVEQLYQANRQLYSPENVIAAAQLNAEWQVLVQNMKELAITIGGPLIHALNFLIQNGRGNDVYSLADQYRRTGHVGFDSEQKSTLDANTKALQANTDATMALRDGIYGGGPNARSAIPGAFRGQFSGGEGGGWESLKNSTHRLGAFGIGS